MKTSRNHVFIAFILGLASPAGTAVAQVGMDPLLLSRFWCRYLYESWLAAHDAYIACENANPTNDPELCEQQWLDSQKAHQNFNTSGCQNFWWL